MSSDVKGEWHSESIGWARTTSQRRTVGALASVPIFVIGLLSIAMVTAPWTRNSINGRKFVKFNCNNLVELLAAAAAGGLEDELRQLKLEGRLGDRKLQEMVLLEPTTAHERCRIKIYQ